MQKPKPQKVNIYNEVNIYSNDFGLPDRHQHKPRVPVLGNRPLRLGSVCSAFMNINRANVQC